MAETVAAPNNIKVEYQGKPTREKPMAETRKKVGKLLKRGMISQKQHDNICAEKS